MVVQYTIIHHASFVVNAYLRIGSFFYVFFALLGVILSFDPISPEYTFEEKGAKRVDGLTVLQSYVLPNRFFFR